MPTPRFLTLDDVAEILAVSWSQAYALVKRRDLLAIQVGGRGQWRVEVDELERYIQQRYAEARAGAVPAPGELAPGDDDAGTQPTGTEPTGTEPTGTEPTGSERAPGRTGGRRRG